MATNETESAPARHERITRRIAIGRFAAGGAAAGVGIAFGRELLGAAGAGAVTGNMQFGAVNNAGSDYTSLTSNNAVSTLEITNTGSGRALEVVGQSTGVNLPSLVVSNTGTNNAVFAVQADNSTSVAAVNAVTWGPGPALAANTLHDNGGGVETNTVDGNGVTAHVNGSGRGVHVKSHDALASAPGIYSDCEGTGAAIEGLGRLGRGGRFRGAKAQIQLVPGSAGNHPASGAPGDLYVDSAKRLWFCRGGVNWVQVV